MSLVAGATVSYLFARKKQRAETTRIELENIKTAIEIWKTTATDLAMEVRSLNIRCEELTKEVIGLRLENHELASRLEQLTQTYNKE